MQEPNIRRMGYVYHLTGRSRDQGEESVFLTQRRNQRMIPALTVSRGLTEGVIQAILETVHIEVISVRIRLAGEEDLDGVNALRKQVNDLHVAGKPEVFKPGFSEQLRDFIRVIWNDPEQEIAVAEQDGDICGFAVLHHIRKPENPFMYERDFLDIDEFCVDEKHRRQGVATALVDFIRGYAKEKGFHRIELNMWEFNQNALAFYEAAGFKTFRRYMEMFI